MLVRADIDRKKKALEEEKSLIDERLNKRKEAEDEAEKYEELAELKRQYALISMDSSRTKDAASIRERIAELEKDIGWDIAEREAESMTESIQQQIDAYDQYQETGDENLDKLLEDANNFGIEVTSILGLSHDDLIAWLKSNDEAYSDSLANTQQQMIQSWTDTWKQMYGIVDTWWPLVDEILGDKSTFLDYMKQSTDYINASVDEQKQMIYQWEEAYDNWRKAHIDNATWSHTDPGAGSWSATEYKGSSGGSSSSGGGGGGGGGSGSGSGSSSVTTGGLITVNGGNVTTGTIGSKTASWYTPASGKGDYSIRFYDKDGNIQIFGGYTLEEAHAIAQAAYAQEQQSIGIIKSSRLDQSGMFTNPDGTTTTPETQTPTTPAPADNGSNVSGTAVVTTSGGSLNLRKGAGTSYDKITTIPNGATVSLLEKSGNWYKVNYNGTVGWVDGSYLNVGGSSSKTTTGTTSSTSASTNGDTSISGTAKVNASGGSARVRSGPGTSYDAVGTIPNGAKVTAVARNSNGWIKVQYGSMTGYISGNLLSNKVGFNEGGIDDFTGLAMLHGTKQKPEGILNAKQFATFRDLTATFDQIAMNDLDKAIIEMADWSKSINFFPDIARMAQGYGDTNNLTVGDVNVYLDNAYLDNEQNIYETAKKVGEVFRKELMKQGISVTTRI